jgi:hypothetical protein
MRPPHPIALRWIVTLAPLGLLPVLTGCAGFGMDVSSTYGPAAKHEPLGTTFNWWPQVQQNEKAGRARNPESDAFIRETIVHELARKGYSATSDQPDFWVDYYVQRKSTGGLRHATWSPVEEEGALVIDILDPATNKHIWRGYARAKMDESAPVSEMEKKVQIAVRLILDRFPDHGKY